MWSGRKLRTSGKGLSGDEEIRRDMEMDGLEVEEVLLHARVEEFLEKVDRVRMDRAGDSYETTIG